MRIDAALVARGLAESRSRAQALIDAGLVKINGEVALKAARKVSEADLIEVLGTDHPYVSRGGLKLARALEAFQADVSGLVCADVGASTGGFTDVLLRNGAKKVYAIDVGTGQLHERLRADPRVVSMERVNARALSPAMFPERPALAVMDVSFISIRLILPALFDTLGPAGRVVTLVKPQFEAGCQAVGKGGIVSKPQAHRQVLRELAAFVPGFGWRVRALEPSPIAGGDGNLEFLADIVPEAGAIDLVGPREIEEVVRRAHEAKLR